jgi:hypothetical protein
MGGAAECLQKSRTHTWQSGKQVVKPSLKRILRLASLKQTSLGQVNRNRKLQPQPRRVSLSSSSPSRLCIADSVTRPLLHFSFTFQGQTPSHRLASRFPSF